MRGIASKLRSGLLASILCWTAMAGAANPGPNAAVDLIRLNNQSLNLVLDPQRGTIAQWSLTDFSADGEAERDLVGPAKRLFQVRGTLAGIPIEAWEDRLGGWTVESQDASSVSLRLAPSDGAFQVTQAWHLPDGQWQADLEITLNAPGLATAADDRLWLEVGPGIGEVPATGLGMAQSIYSFTEVIHRDDSGIHRVRHDSANLDSASACRENLRWKGLQSRYFALILSPQNDATQNLPWRSIAPGTPAWYPDHPSFETALQIDLRSGTGTKAPQSYAWRIYGGGKAYQALHSAEPALDELLFPNLWNWMRWLTLGIMHLLYALHALVGNWGLAIILLAVLVRVVMHPIARNAMASQQRFVTLQRQIQPELELIKQQYRGGEQSERILQLYERHQVSPLAGLKPLLIVMLQIPVFVALYHLLGQAFELRNESFLWMDTLAEPDQLFAFGVDLPFFGSYFNLLPALMAITTLASIRMSPAPAATRQAAARQNVMLALMALGFFLLFYSFPSGMVLYWTMANLLHLLHGVTVGRLRRPRDTSPAS